MPMLSRRTSPPGEWYFFQSQTNWPPMDQIRFFFKGKTFDQVVEEIIKHREANPRFKLSTDFAEVSNELDFFTCARLKWDPNYCSRGPEGKAFSPSRVPAAGASVNPAVANPVSKVAKLASGLGVLLDWLGSGGKAVEQAQSNRRASICAGCPRNQPGDWESFFTGMAAEKIRQQLEVRNQMKLKTEVDDRLNVCEACLCFLRLKVHVPLEHALKKLKPAMEAELDPRCWILKERQAMNAETTKAV